MNLPSLMPARLRGAPVLLIALLAACADRVPLATAPPSVGEAPALQVTCTASRVDGSVSCASPAPTGAQRAIYGGQGSLVRLRSSAVSYTAADSIFQFSVDVENLLAQAIGTTDGITAHAEGIRVFFHSGPSVTGGSGSIEVANADGSETFTSTNQPYFQYAGNLAAGDTTAAKVWRLRMPATVSTFTFTLYVEAELAPALVINEVMPNPSAVLDPSGEWIEVYNRGIEAVNLQGWRVASANDAGHQIASTLMVPAHGYVVLGNNADFASNGGVPVAYAYSSVVLNNSNSDWVALRTPTGASHDSVHWGMGTNVPTAASRMLNAPGLDNTILMGASWTTATTGYAAGTDKGTPGGANDGSGGGGGPTPGTATTIVVSPAGVSLAPGGTRQITAVLRDSAGSITSGSVTWSSTASGVASVNASGLVSAIADGSAMVIGTLASGGADTVDVVVATSSGTAIYRNHVEFGTPSGGGNLIILTKPSYVVGYSPLRGGPAWVSWNLNATHFGDAARCDCFAADATLPDSVYKVVTSDYTGSGYSRGHMVMSEQRTSTPAENAVTFLMTNVLPQYQDMNGGPWLKFEFYSNDLARVSNREVYNISGGIYSASPATLNGAGRVQIPSHTWKVIVVMNAGQGLANVTSASDIQVYAVNMPNVTGIQANDWPMYRVSVDSIEALTGLDLLSSLPDSIEAAVEATSS